MLRSFLGYHLNKRHWISIAAGLDVSNDLVEDLVLDAYHLVRRGLAKALRNQHGWDE